MIRILLVYLLPVGLALAAGYLLWKGIAQALGKLRQVEYVYVRYRDGVLTLKKEGTVSEEEVNFKPGGTWQDLGPKQLAAHCGGVNWYFYPSGHLVEIGSDEEAAISRCLRFADNTGLLEAEISTE
jgi:hypothetical protein